MRVTPGAETHNAMMVCGCGRIVILMRNKGKSTKKRRRNIPGAETYTVMAECGCGRMKRLLIPLSLLQI
jgi:hypothetical protein